MRRPRLDGAVGGPLSLRLRVGPYLVEVAADDSRAIRAIEELAVDDSAVDPGRKAPRRLRGAEKPAEATCTLTLTAEGEAPPSDLPPSEEAAAVFEDIELHTSAERRILIVGRRSFVEIVPGAGTPSAQGRIAPLHLDRPWIVAHRIFTLSVIELLRCLGACYLHAGCVADGEKGVLICGASGQGKSTLTYALARSGFSFVSDDGVFLRRSQTGIEVFSWPEKLKLDRRSCSFFEELRPYADTRVKTEIPLHRTRIEHVAVAAQPVALIVPVRGSRPTSAVGPLAKRDAFSRALAQTIPLLEPDGMNAQLDIVSELVRSCRCLELTAGTDFDRIPTIVRSAVFAPGGF
jgi:hypothetical protein